MDALEQLEEKYASSDLLQTFNRDETVALMDLAFLVVMIDGEVTDEELEQLKERVGALTADGEEWTDDELEDHGTETRDEIQAINEGDDGPTDFIEARRDVFTEEKHQAKALEVLGTLAYSDGLQDQEEGICHLIGRTFGFDEDRIEDLLLSGAVDLWELGSDEVR